MKISIIVPIYNSAKSLNECINSILSQCYNDFELLLINDGSTDISDQICNEFAKSDSRVRVFHKENGGVSSARNFGLENAKGDWITFVDSDDYIGKEYFNKLSFTSDFILLNIKRILNNEIFDFLSFENQTFDFMIFINKFHLYPHFPGPCGKFFKKEIINNNNIRFDENLDFGEDALFNVTYLRFVKTIETSKKTSYYYRDSINSLSKKKYTFIEDQYFFLKIKAILYFFDDDEMLNRYIIFPLNRMLISLYNDSSISMKFKKKYVEILIDENYDSIIYLYKNSKFKYLIYISNKFNSYFLLNLIFSKKLKC